MERLDSTNRRELSRLTAAELGADPLKVDQVVRAFLDCVEGELALGNSVNLRGFGTFEPRRMNPVTRRRPDTGEPIEKPPSRRVLFRPSPALKARVNES